MTKSEQEILYFNKDNLQSSQLPNYHVRLLSFPSKCVWGVWPRAPLPQPPAVEALGGSDGHASGKGGVGLPIPPGKPVLR